MKRISTLLSVLFSAALVFSSFKGGIQESTADIQFTKELHDFGDIKQGAPTSVEFAFKNTGKEPLILSNVQASCGCTVPEWTKEPIAAGKTGTIKVSYNSNNLGIFTKNVTVYSNAASGTKTLTIKGNVISEPKSPIILDQR